MTLLLSFLFFYQFGWNWYWYIIAVAVWGAETYYWSEVHDLLLNKNI